MTLRNVSRFRSAALSVALTALLSACAGNILPGAGNDPPSLYVLTPKTTFAEDLPKVDWQLTIPLPIADAALNTARITLRQNPISLEYYARANWVDTAPQMIQTLLVESFENSGKIVGVGRQSVTLRADYSLLTDLREFQAEYLGAGPPRVRVRLNAKLVKMPQRTILATETFEFLEPAASSDLEAVISAFDIALGKTLKRIVEWSLKAVPAKSPRARR
ncbi:MAG: cholesterol transport system auxiliary component [Paracoccaceae bacterium]|jgi:cholesterol transport system auxiliary component